MSKKENSPLCLSPEKNAILERRYQEDGSRSITAFIERAVDFYLDCLSANDAGLFLPTSIMSYLDGGMGQMEERLSSIAFRQAVEQDMAAGILADTYQFGHEDLRRRRAESVQNVRKTNGRISLEQRVRGAWEENAACLGYDNAKTWRDLLQANQNDIAASMNIPPNHFRRYAAFHDEGKHPHVHIMAWSTQPGEAYLTRDGIRNIKSTLTNQIFKQEMLHTYEQKSQLRDELVREARRAIRQLTQEVARRICTVPEIEQKMERLAEQMEMVKGKKSYGYIPKSVKKTVDEAVDKLEELPVVRACCDQWCRLQGEVEGYYHDKPKNEKNCPRRKSFGR